MFKLKFSCQIIGLILCLQSLSLSAQTIKTVIHKDGSFNILGKDVKIMNCYPALDNQSLKALSIKITEKGNSKTIEYTLANGKVMLQIGNEDAALTVNTKIEGLNFIPAYISIIHDAEVMGVKKLYKTPVMIGGKGGVKNWPEAVEQYPDCHSITGLVNENGAAMVVSTRNYKKYISQIRPYPSQQNGGRHLIDVNISTEKVSTTDLPTYYFTENVSAYDAMRNEATAAAKFMGAKNNKPQSYHWCSWYFTYYHLDQTMVSDYLKGFKAISPAVNIQTFQIDAGYHPHLGDWLDPSFKFPKGIEPSVKEIISKGYKAGIWIGPYMVGNRSKLYAEHPDWILRKKDGKPIIQMTFYGEERLWGLIDEETYVLDTSNPAVMAYLRSVFHQFKQMGITFFKTDFMYYGWESSNNVIRFKPGKTSSEYQREFFDMIREEIGPDSYWLGCIAPFPVMLGYVDGMRMAGDISPKWEANANMYDEMKGGQHINNVWWQNDADALIIREKYSYLTDEETKSLAYWVSMMGGVVNTSDLFHEIPKERVELFRFLEPGTEKYSARIPWITGDEKFEVLTREFKPQKSHAVLFTNRSDVKSTVTYTLKSLVGINQATCFLWDVASTQKLGVMESLTIELNPHQSKLIYISVDGKSPDGMTLGGKSK